MKKYYSPQKKKAERKKNNKGSSILFQLPSPFQGLYLNK